MSVIQYSDAHIINSGITEFSIDEYSSNSLNSANMCDYFANVVNTFFEKLEFNQYGTNCGNCEIEEFFMRSLVSENSSNNLH
jgi:hypothetical protein